MRVAIYTRVSTRMQAREGVSLEAQQSKLTQYAQAHNLQVVGIYSDKGFSGKNADREDYIKVLKLASQGMIDGVLVWKLTRFSRNFRDLVNVATDFEKRGQTIISYSENIDLHSASGKMTFNILATVSQFEREVIVENTKSGQYQKVLSGLPDAACTLGYQKKDGIITVIPWEAETVKLAFELYVQNCSYTKTLKRLIDSGRKTKRGRNMNPATLSSVLHNPIYCGYARYHGEVVFKRRIVPPIISDELFDSVQLRLNASNLGKGKFLQEWLG